MERKLKALPKTWHLGNFHKRKNFQTAEKLKKF